MSNLNELFKQVSLEHMSQLDEIIALGSSVSNESKVLTFIDSGKSKFYDYVQRVHHFLKSLSLDHKIFSHIDARELLKKYGAQDYSKNRSLNFEVAAGFSGDLPEFLTFMVEHVLPAADAIENTLKITVTRLAQILNEPDRMKAQSGIRELEQHLVLVKEGDLEKIKSYFKAGAKSQVKIGDVMRRNADMETVYRLTNVWNERLAKIDFKRAQNLVERVGDLTGHLNKQLNETGEGQEKTEVSGLTASQLSDLFYRLGTTVTACSVLIEMGRQHSEAMKRNLDALEAQLPADLDKDFANLGNQSVRIRELMKTHPSELKQLAKKMNDLSEFIDTLNKSAARKATDIYDTMCDYDYLKAISDDKSAVKKFATDLAAAERAIKELAA